MTELYGGSMQFTQDADDCADTDALQILTFEICDGGAGKYVRFKTDGWAIDKLDEFGDLYLRVRKAFELTEVEK